MCNNKSCYLCKNLVFFDSDEHKGYYCTLTDKKLINEEAECFCMSYFVEDEE